jgi:colicin import membrane protein
MKKFTTFVIMLAMALSTSAQDASNGIQGEQPQRKALFERRSKIVDAKYLKGGVPEVNGKVTWEKTYKVEGLTADQIYDKALAYFSNLVKSENQTERSAVAGVDRVGHKILIRSQEWLVFSDKLFALDRTKMNYAASIECSDGVCKVLITNISYIYEEGRPSEARYTAEEMISDKVAFNKKGTGFTKGGTKKFRICTIDRMEQILTQFVRSLK